jgi:uncharacterized protein
MSMKRISHPSEVLSVGDIVTVYVLDVDEAKGRVALSLLPKEKLDVRDAMMAANRRNRSDRRGKNKNNRRQEEKKPVTMEDATARLLARFGKH